ncbi:hypothetical protein PF002_g14002 [Phytophthora fragariae]|uniref:Uncharacterized protein n=1 Tax=Phytophthora fragariae TaxID=53985 RepID=A0A6A3YZF1_9STRA|nr:hypothetical protein PF002_g14002 [Phytophthora fragariae]
MPCRASRRPSTASLGAGWCFLYSKVLKATGSSVARGGVVLPTDQDTRPLDNRAQRDVVLPLQQGPQGNRAERRSGRGDTSTTTRA